MTAPGTSATEFPFEGNLIDGIEAAKWLKSGLVSCKTLVSLCSAFIRSEALLEVLPPGNQQHNVRILVRWKLDDLLCGASDLDVFGVVQAAGWHMYMRLDFHGKVYTVPGFGVVVGSANATNKGLGFSASSNLEVCTLVRDSPSNLRITDSFFEGATLIDERLFMAVQDCVADHEGRGVTTGDWPANVKEKLVKPSSPTYLLVSQCLLSKPNWLLEGDREASGPEELHDLAILSVSTQNARNLELIRTRFRSLAIFAWLKSSLTNNGGEAYFGELSARLHSVLADSPAPCRRDVKILLQTLLEWVVGLEIKEIVIDRPNHSQRVRITK